MFTKNLKWISLESNPALHGDTPASDRLSHSASAIAKQKQPHIPSLEEWWHNKMVFPLPKKDL